MTVPSAKSIVNGTSLRLRNRSASSKTKLSCTYIIVGLIALQLGLFLVVTTIGNPLRGEAWRRTDGDQSTYYSWKHDVKGQAELKKRLAKFEEGDAMQNRVLYSPEHTGSTEGLDNYGSRTHFPKKSSWASNGPYLIVGGSDGSGTRAVVDQLIELGTFIYFEDRRTMDIHGAEMFKKGMFCWNSICFLEKAPVPI